MTVELTPSTPAPASFPDAAMGMTSLAHSGYGPPLPSISHGGGDAVLRQIFAQKDIKPCRHKASSSDQGQEKVAGLILDKDVHFMANPSYIYIMEM